MRSVASAAATRNDTSRFAGNAKERSERIRQGEAGKAPVGFFERGDPPVMRGKHDAFELFAGKCIQNNHSETTNNTLRTVACLGG